MDSYTDPIRVDARDLSAGDLLHAAATGPDYHTSAFHRSIPLGTQRSTCPPTPRRRRWWRK